MAYHDWHVGMKVVCIDAEWRGRGLQTLNGDACPLVEGHVYEIAAIGLSNGLYQAQGASGMSVRLVGVQKPSSTKHLFNAARFRPVQQRKTDIGIFTAMLNPQRQGVDA